MREKLNENPVAQAGLIGLLVLVVGFMFYTRVLSAGGGEPPPLPEDPAATAPGVVPAADGSVPATGDSAAIPEHTDAATDAAPTPPSSEGTPAAAPGEFVAGRGLPDEVVKAYKDGKAIALLIKRGQGIDDRRMKNRVGALRSRDDVAVFITNAHGVGDYARIANGVDIERVPALVVVRPRKFAEQGTPAATIHYGFHGSKSVGQAIRDAFYAGSDNLSYHPG